MEYFIVVPPGFETLAYLELGEKIPDIGTVEISKGGLRLFGEKDLVESLNTRLKIPTAVLVRIDQFKVRDFPKLFNKITKIKWSEWLLGPDQKFEVSVSCAKSRLMNKKRIEEAVLDGIRRYFKNQPAKKEYALLAKKTTQIVEIQIRIVDDVCTVSFDSSGDPLFKRGYKELVGAAPIRENLAAGLYYALKNKAGGGNQLVDPMCGSGTLLLEAAAFHHPTIGRKFGFELAPQFSSLSTALQKQSDEHVNIKSPLDNILGLDSSDDILKSFKKNIQNLEKNIGGLPPISAWDLRKHDLKKTLSWAETKKAGDVRLAICNPPYNERLRLPLPPKEFYQVLFDRFSELEVDAFGWIVPGKISRHIAVEFGKFKRIEKIAFSNGGIPVEFQIFKN